MKFAFLFLCAVVVLSLGSLEAPIDREEDLSDRYGVSSQQSSNTNLDPEGVKALKDKVKVFDADTENFVKESYELFQESNEAFQVQKLPKLLVALGLPKPLPESETFTFMKQFLDPEESGVFTLEELWNFLKRASNLISFKGHRSLEPDDKRSLELARKFSSDVNQDLKTDLRVANEPSIQAELLLNKKGAQAPLKNKFPEDPEKENLGSSQTLNTSVKSTEDTKQLNTDYSDPSERGVFDRFALTTGVASIDSISNMLVELGYDVPSEVSLKTLKKTLDPFNVGIFEFKSFKDLVGRIDELFKLAHLYTTHHETIDSGKLLTSLFQAIDLNGDELITDDEFSAVVSQFGVTISQQQTRTLLQEFDINNDVSLNFDEWQIMLSSSIIQKDELPSFIGASKGITNFLSVFMQKNGNHQEIATIAANKPAQVVETPTVVASKSVQVVEAPISFEVVETPISVQAVTTSVAAANKPVQDTETATIVANKRVQDVEAAIIVSNKPAQDMNMSSLEERFSSDLGTFPENPVALPAFVIPDLGTTETSDYLPQNYAGTPLNFDVDTITGIAAPLPSTTNWGSEATQKTAIQEEEEIETLRV